MAQHRWDTASPGQGARAALQPMADSEDEPEDGTGCTVGRAGEECGPEALPAKRRWAFSFPAAVLAACLLCGCTAAVFLFRDQTPVPVSSVDLATAAPEPPGDGVPSGDTGAPGDDGSSRAGQPPVPVTRGTESGRAGTVVVHVAGAVQRPGVVRLPAGSRIVDAVDAAGGTAADVDLAAVNLAAVLEDGAMVLVPRIGEAAVPPGGDGAGIPGPGSAPDAASGTPTGPGAAINLNTADSDLLQTLPRVGPVLAERIIAWRTEHGKFTRPEDLDAVPGIGEAMLAALLPLVAV